MLDPEIAGGVAGRSTTNFTHDNHVNDQNSHRHDNVEHDFFNSSNRITAVQIVTRGVDSFRDQRDQGETDDDFLRSGCRTQHVSLFTFTVSHSIHICSLHMRSIRCWFSFVVSGRVTVLL